VRPEERERVRKKKALRRNIKKTIRSRHKQANKSRDRTAYAMLWFTLVLVGAFVIFVMPWRDEV
jgi:hypothetical protein